MNVMLDFETLDTTPSTVVLSLGVVVFDEKKILKEKYYKFKVQNQLDQGRSVSLSTLLFWLGQGESAKVVLKPDDSDITLKEFIKDFTEFLKEYGAGIKPWSNGADFDLPIAVDIFKQYGKGVPWMFWNSKCFRTYCAENKIPKLAFAEGAVKHNALDDAKNQVQRLLKYWSKTK